MPLQHWHARLITAYLEGGVLVRGKAGQARCRSRIGPGESPRLPAEHGGLPPNDDADRNSDIAGQHWDVVIIGAGPGGGTLPLRLAQTTGKRVLLVERGHALPREAENWQSDKVFGARRYATNETWRDKRGRGFKPQTHYGLGGNSKLYGAALFRLRERDFGEVRHHGGISPAWPLGYADFAPYYREAEVLYHVHGRRGVDPTDPPDTQDYAHPPLADEPAIAALANSLGRAGYHPFPLPMGLLRDDADPDNSPCILCSTCDGSPCLLHAKADAEVIAVRPALRTGHVTLLQDAQAERLITGAGGREVTGVELVHADGRRGTVRGDVVVLACGSINPAALLLRSANAQHPNGLANGSGVVGRHYMCHINSAVIALMPELNPTRFQKTIGLNDFYWGGNGHDHPLGHVQMLGKTDAGTLAAELPVPAPRSLLVAVARRTMDFWMMTEDLPSASNRVTLTQDGGVQLAYTSNNGTAHKQLRQAFKKALDGAGHQMRFLPRRLYLGQQIGLPGVAHQCGTVRFGTDPQQSALNLDCQAHELDNLYVVDGSFFPSSGAVNPTLTIIANALRVADHIRGRLS